MEPGAATMSFLSLEPENGAARRGVLTGPIEPPEEAEAAALTQAQQIVDSFQPSAADL